MEPEPFHPLGPESGRDHSGCVRRNLAICQNFLWETEPRVGRPGDPPWSPWKGSENPDSAAQLLAMLTQPPPGLGVQHRAGHSRCLTMPGVATEALHKELLCHDTLFCTRAVGVEAQGISLDKSESNLWIYAKFQVSFTNLNVNIHSHLAGRTRELS